MPDRVLAKDAIKGGQGGGAAGIQTGVLFRLRCFLVTCVVYLDAFRLAPKPFLTATKWRVRGKRMRARGQFAPLLNHSRWAYRLWMMRREGEDTANTVRDQPAFPIIALLDATGNIPREGLDRTLACLRSLGVPNIVVGAPGETCWNAVADQIDWTQQPWLLPIQAGDTLAGKAIATYRGAIAQGERNVVYADDDLLGRGNTRCNPHFKPAWNAPLFNHWDYLSGACIVRASAVDLISLALAPDWPETLVRRVIASAAKAPLHVAAVLHHRQRRPLPRLPAQPVALLSELPPMSVIIPTRNRVDLLRNCIDGLAKTQYPDMEVIVVDNDSDEPETLAYLARLDAARYRVLHYPGPYNYPAINNRAVEHAGGRLICLLNNDIEMLDSNWLAIMASSAVRPDVGAVGARLLYPDGRIQHAGVVLGISAAAAHAHRLIDPESTGYFSRHNLPQFVSAVTAACLVVSREKYLTVGMMDETAFPVAFNDVDLCLKLNERGWQSFYEPRATLIHHESLSRGHDHDPVGAARLARELVVLRQRWGTDRLVDPFHHPELSRDGERFAIAM